MEEFGDFETSSTLVDGHHRELVEVCRAWEARSHAILDTVPDAVVSSDATGRIESFNKAAERLFGFVESEVVGQSVTLLMPAPYRDGHDAHIQRYIRTGDPHIIGKARRDVTGMRKDGSTFPVELGIGEWWDHGERKFTAIIHDISERKRVEQELRESEERFRTMADSAPVLLWMSGPDGGCTFFNRGWLELTGRTLEAELGEGWVEGVHPDDAPSRWSTYRAALAKGEPFRARYRLRRADGEYAWVYDTGMPRRTADGTFAGYIGAAMDVTEMTRMGEELRQAQKLEAIGALASGVAHDFNNLLMGIMGCASIARSALPPDSPAHIHLEEIKRSAAAGAAISKQLLAFSRKREAVSTVIELNALIWSMERMLTRLLGENVELTLRLGNDDTRVRCDVGHMEQVLMNLVVNARDAMPQGGELQLASRVVSLTDSNEYGLPAGDFVALEVSDTGVGMSSETLEHIFEPFFTTKAVGKGTGLGLSTVFGIVSQLGGRTSVSSEVGRGTTFHILIPRSNDAITLDLRPASNARAAKPLGSGTILVVEDERAVRMGTRFYLEQGGYRVLEASTGVEAAECLERFRGEIDLLLTDVVLPGMGGREIARLARERRPGLVVAYMSAHPIEHLVATCQIDEGSCAMQKPFDGDDLLAYVRNVMGGKAA